MALACDTKVREIPESTNAKQPVTMILNDLSYNPPASPIYGAWESFGPMAINEASLCSEPK